MIKFIKKILGIKKIEDDLKSTNTMLSYHRSKLNQELSKLKEFSRIDADVGIRGNNTIILTGVLNGKAYVKFYDLGDGEFIKLVEQLRWMKDSHLIRNIDAPAPFIGAFELEDIN